MESKMIVKIEEYLAKLNKKSVKITQKGFIMNQFFIDSLVYKVQSDILNLKDEEKEVYMSLNLNQVYQVEIGNNVLILFMDNDTEIQICL